MKDELILIQENFEPHNTTRKHVEFSNWYIRTPRVGYIPKQYWEYIKRFQNINVDIDNDKTIDKSEAVKWKSLQKESKEFTGTVHEFNLLVEQRGDKQYIERFGSNNVYELCRCEISKELWKEVNVKISKCKNTCSTTQYAADITKDLPKLKKCNLPYKQQGRLVKEFIIKMGLNNEFLNMINKGQ